MGQALYRKYRSKTLDEIIGQDHITNTLKRAIATDHIAHAYLFTGPRGVGKTSIARILAHEFNHVPYVTEDSHLDIIEIDAASNGGVDEIRDLRERVHIAPSSGRYKVYIIDEVHMMTTPAFNALLKTLEEPPAHAIFILATTEAHKLPATIISRTQRFTFKPVPFDTISVHLRQIAEQEKIDITDEALHLIAELSEGSFRDSISMLDQAASSAQHIDRSYIESLLGIPAATMADDLLTVITSGDAHSLVDQLTQLKLEGFQASVVAKQLSTALRDHLLNSSGQLDRPIIVAMLKRLIDVPASNRPDQLLEIVLLETLLECSNANRLPRTLAAAAAPGENEVSPSPIASQKAAIPASIVQIKSEQHQPVTSADTDLAPAIDEAQWQSVLVALGKQYNTLYGIIRMAKPEFSPGKIKLTFGFVFHQKRANDTKNKQILMAVIENTTGYQLGIECLFDKTVTPPGPGTPITAVSPPAPSISTINNIFGGGEILHS